MPAKIKIATKEDIPQIVDLLSAMQNELGEHTVDIGRLTKRLLDNAGDITWFLFYDENNTLFGTIFAQPRHAYWKDAPDYYVGGAYILPEFRGRGYYRQIMSYIENWVRDNGGNRLVGMVAKENNHSAKSLLAMGWHESNYVEYLQDL